MTPQIPFHPSHWIGTVQQWWPTDTQERYEHLMEDLEYQAYVKEQGWDKPNAITYCINKQGYRDETELGEFVPTDNNLLALGCSFTMGIGLPYSDIWPTMIANKLALRACNFGWGGASSDRCFRLAEYWIPYLKPKLVILLNPPRGRTEIVIDEKTGEAQDIWPGNDELDAHIKKWLLVDENSRLNNLKNKLAIQALCQNLNIPYMAYEADTWMSRSRELAGYARDKFHAGPIGHRSFVEYVLDDWAKK
jgi:hypothetical protein